MLFTKYIRMDVIYLKQTTQKDWFIFWYTWKLKITLFNLKELGYHCSFDIEKCSLNLVSPIYKIIRVVLQYLKATFPLELDISL